MVCGRGGGQSANSSKVGSPSYTTSFMTDPLSLPRPITSNPSFLPVFSNQPPSTNPLLWKLSAHFGRSLSFIPADQGLISAFIATITFTSAFTSPFSDVEIHVEGTLFSAHINPYFLRLNFPYPVLEDDDSSASYDPSSGTLTVRLTKETKGLHFPDLDLLTKLLAPRSAAALNDEGRTKGPLIEVLDSRSPDQLAEELDDKLRLDLEQEHAAFVRAAQNDWQIDQEAPDDELLDAGPSISTCTPYGFLNLHTGYFTNVIHTENEVNELGAEAENSTLARRRQLREASEEAKWDEEHYIADFVDDEIIKELMSTELPPEGIFVFTEEENMTMFYKLHFAPSSLLRSTIGERHKATRRPNRLGQYVNSFRRSLLLIRARLQSLFVRLCGRRTDGCCSAPWPGHACRYPTTISNQKDSG
ncbi:PIH1 domain-containing protein [Rhizoctonia solani AG-1 IA]|uniref:PIH1 domain-containing protein n=1 Tax=Thanatephorus cucumeris (strain AG1-IA) TaxID=983506 RepID=L8X337_THACA|nr:PIH1 domain-containing protein [Rhizoctonia solani AG-1 IA]